MEEKRVTTEYKQEVRDDKERKRLARKSQIVTKRDILWTSFESDIEAEDYINKLVDDK